MSPTRRQALALPLASSVILGFAVNAALADPPARVGRLSYMEGTVSFHTADQEQWSPATLNYPVTTGNSFYTDTNSRAEIEVGPAILRLDQGTAADIARLDDTATQIEIDQGDVNLNLMSVPPGGVQVLTPLGQIDLMQPGIYDINAGQPNGNQPPSQVLVTTLQGSAQIDQGAPIPAGQTAMLSGNPPTVTMGQGGPTAFDQWASARDQKEAAARTPRYVSAQMTGYEDLNTYGNWSSDPNYGQVWYPSDVASDWQPYTYGHWAYVGPWGWTWIDDSPWGFAPFHYGRWAYFGNRWGWVPGTVTATPVYAPALVTFIGGNGWGVSLAGGAAIGAIGWVALAPNEVFHPYYPVSVRYARNVNVMNVNRTVINQINVTNYNTTNVRVNNFRNARAATVIPAGAFANAAPVQRAALNIPQQQLAQAQIRGSLAQVRATPAARAAVAQPAAATAFVARPHAEAAIARGPVSASGAQPQALAAIAAPKAPGPTFRPQASAGRPGFRATPATAPGNAPRPSPAVAPGNAPRPGPTPAAAPATIPRPTPVVPGSRAPSVHVLPPPNAAPAIARPTPGAPATNETERRGPVPPGATPQRAEPAVLRPPTPAPTPGAPANETERRGPVPPGAAPQRAEPAVARPPTPPPTPGAPTTNETERRGPVPPGANPERSEPRAPAEPPRTPAVEQNREAPRPPVAQPAAAPHAPPAPPPRPEARPEVQPAHVPAPPAPPRPADPARAPAPPPAPPRPPAPAPAAAPPHPPAPPPAAAHPPAPPPAAAHPAPPPAKGPPPKPGEEEPK